MENKAVSKKRSPRKPPVLLPKELNENQRLNVAEVGALHGIGVSTVWAFVKAGRIPEPERYGARCSRWKAGDILAALNGEV